MTFSNASAGCAPTTSRPLMKNVGVPLAPAAVPAFLSCSTSSLIFGSSQSFLNFATFSPTSPAYFSISGFPSVLKLSYILSCSAQALSWFWRAAAWNAIAAPIAFAWNGSGWFIHTSATSLPYFLSRPFTVGSDRLQNGHSKSLNSTIVTFAAAGPRRTLCANGITFFEPPATGASLGFADPPDGFCLSSIAARMSPSPLPCFTRSMAAFARFGLRGQFGSFLTQPAILPMPQPHSQSRSLSACITVTFCAGVRSVRLTVVTEAQSLDLVQSVGELALGLVDLRRHLGAGPGLAHDGGGLAASAPTGVADFPPDQETDREAGEQRPHGRDPRRTARRFVLRHRGGLPQLGARRVMRQRVHRSQVRDPGRVPRPPR